LAVLGAAVMLMNAHYAVASPQDAQAKKAKAVKDTGEYDIYNDVIKDANPQAPNYKKLLTDLDTWTQKYPNTDYKDERTAYYVQGYGGTGQAAKALDAVSGLIGGGVAGLKSSLGSASLILPTLVLAVASVAQDAGTGNPTPAELETGTKVSNLLLEYAKDWFVPANMPSGLTADQWALGLKQMQDTANAAHLQIALYPGLSILGRPTASKDPAVCAKAEPALVKAVQDWPDSGQIALQLANTLFCQRATAEKLQQSLYEYARAVVLAPVPPMGLDPVKQQQTFDDFLKRTYTTVHGSDEGLAELKESAKNSPLPPAGFKIKTAGERAIEQQAEFAQKNPQLAMWMGIEGQLSEGGTAYFEGQLKDTDIKGEKGARALKGTVVDALVKTADRPAKSTNCNPNVLLVAIPLPGQTGDVAKVKLQMLNGTLKGKVEKGADVQWDGVPSAFTKEPFLLTMDLEDKTKVDVATTACPAPAPARKGAPAAKKKGGE
jgi:hypothetical protein